MFSIDGYAMVFCVFVPKYGVLYRYCKCFKGGVCLYVTLRGGDGAYNDDSINETTTSRTTNRRFSPHLPLGDLSPRLG